MMISLIIIGAIVLFMAIYLYTTYNNLKKIGNWTDNAFAQIDVQLKRQANLIPDLIETIKEYAAHEKSTFEKITQLRKEMVSKKTTAKQKTDANNQLVDSVKSGDIFAIREAYPDLKANENFMKFQETLESTANRIASVRGSYNTAVTTFNNKRDVLPTVLFASTLGFPRRDLLEASEAEREHPTVNF